MSDNIKVKLIPLALYIFLIQKTELFKKLLFFFSPVKSLRN